MRSLGLGMEDTIVVCTYVCREKREHLNYLGTYVTVCHMVRCTYLLQVVSTYICTLEERLGTKYRESDPRHWTKNVQLKLERVPRCCELSENLRDGLLHTVSWIIKMVDSLFSSLHHPTQNGVEF